MIYRWRRGGGAVRFPPLLLLLLMTVACRSAPAVEEFRGGAGGETAVVQALEPAVARGVEAAVRLPAEPDVEPAAARAAGPSAAPATQPLLHYDPYLFGRAIAQVEGHPPRPLDGARVLILPHHWLAGPLILGPLRDLAAGRGMGVVEAGPPVDAAARGAVRRVLLVGPDHGNVGADHVSTSSRSWSTPFGRVEVDGALVDALVAAGLARRQDELLAAEHAVAGLVPALAREMPAASVVPLLLRGDMPAERVRRLATALLPFLNDETVLVAAVDFAHGVRVADVPRLNGESIAALRSLDGATVLRWGNEHLDSPESILLAMEVARHLGATRFELLASTDASAFGAPAGEPVTSYVVGVYR